MLMRLRRCVQVLRQVLMQSVKGVQVRRRSRRWRRSSRLC